MLWTGKRKKLLRLLTLTTAHNAAVNPNLGRGGGSILPLCWLSLDKSETVKAVNLAFGSIQQLFNRYIRAKVGISNLPQSPVIGQNSDGSISDFRISGQFLIKENLHNSGTSNDIDMKLGPVTKLDKKNKTTSKKFDDDVMSENCDVIVIFRIFGQFGAVRRPDSGHRVCKSYVFSNSNLLSYKNSKQN